MQYIVQRKENDEWQAIIYEGLPLVLFEGQPIPPTVANGETRCIPLHETEALA